jgi:hypothetical protein
MNKDRRVTGQVCIELMKECAEWGEMSEASYASLLEAVGTMHQGEYWSLRNQERHEGKNESTDAQIAISRVALPALDAALKALRSEDYDTAIDQLTLAITTEGAISKKRSKKGLVKPRA